MKDKIYIYDVDETLITINSYKHWVVHLLFFSIFTLNVKFIFCVLFLFYKKRKGFISRWEVKRSIISSVLTNKTLLFYSEKVFSKYLSFYLRKEILTKIKFDVSIIATAAPDIYILPLFDKYNFLGILSTKTDREYIFENLSESKMTSVLNEFVGFDYILYTDHYDDLPLSKICKKVYLVNPNPITIEIFKENKINFEEVSG